MLRNLVLIALMGCVSQSEYDKVAAERDSLAAKVGELEKKASDLDGQSKELQAKLDSAASEAAKAKSMAAASELLSAANLQPGQKLSATLTTSLGDIRCELFPDKAPKTVANFVGLAEGTKEWTDPRSGQKVKKPLYDGTIFHRVISGFMIQGGDPLGNGTGGPGYQFEDEKNGLKFEKPGILAMANAGPDTNGSQFFITDSTPHHLDGRHTIFGQCDLEVSKKIIAVETGPGDRPKKDVTITKIAFTRG